MSEGFHSHHEPPGARHVLLYDGVCALCNESVRFVIARDREGRFAFAPLQGPTAAGLLARHSLGEDLETLVLALDLETPRERILTRSSAVLAILRELGRPWSLLAALRAVPTPLRDAVYRLVARHRYRWFGRYESCPLPPAGARHRFLD